MAIEIIPKPEIKKIPWLKITLYFCWAIFLALFLSYFTLFFYQKKLTEELSKLEKTLVRTSSEAALEEKILSWQRKIDDFNVLLTSHQLPTKLFEFLEENTHPKVWFSELKLILKERKIEISGTADNFETLGQQTLVFETKDVIKDLRLSEVLIGREGEIKFKLHLSFDPQILK